MKKEQSNKATVKLLKVETTLIKKRSHSYEAVQIIDAKGNGIARVWDKADATPIVQAVNEHAALNAVAEAGIALKNGIENMIDDDKVMKLMQKVSGAEETLAAIRSGKVVAS